MELALQVTCISSVKEYHNNDVELIMIILNATLFSTFHDMKHPQWRNKIRKIMSHNLTSKRIFPNFNICD